MKGLLQNIKVKFFLQQPVFTNRQIPNQLPDDRKQFLQALFAEPKLGVINNDSWNTHNGMLISKFRKPGYVDHFRFN